MVMKFRYKPRMKLRYKVNKTLADSKKFKELAKKMDEARKDSGFMKFVEKFIAYHTGKTS